MALNTLPANCNDAINVAILPSTTQTSSSTGVNDGAGAVASAGYINAIGSYTSAYLELATTAISGTSATLDVYVQRVQPDNTNWDDVAHFTQVSATGRQNLTVTSATANPYTPRDATLTAGTVFVSHLGSRWRVKWVIAGTNPSVTFAVTGNFYA